MSIYSTLSNLLILRDMAMVASVKKRQQKGGMQGLSGYHFGMIKW